MEKAAVVLQEIDGLHRPATYEHESGRVETYCSECSNYYRRAFVHYPCLTVKLARQAGERP